jgi:hypothetical protein
MLAVQISLLLLLLVICSFTPGFFFVRRFRWTPLEKFCGSIGLSLALIYLAAWAIFCFGPADERPAYDLIVLIPLVLGLRLRADIKRLLRSFRCRQAILGYICLLGFTFLMLGMIRVYSGAGWAGDWHEHFQRSLFFLHRLPPQVQMNGYAFPARPPMMNVLGAFFMGVIDDRYELFQAAFAFLNLLAFFPCLLIAPSLSKARRYVLPLVVFFAASPPIMENVTYTWTRGLTAFFVVLGFFFYLAGLRKNDSNRVVAGFLSTAAALLVHYSAGPYLLFLALHYALRFFRRRPRPWRESAIILAGCALFLFTWFGWSLAVYGPRTTLASNTTVTASQNYQGSTVGKIAWNIYASLVPIRLRGDVLPFPLQDNRAALLRDEAFLVYQVNLIFGMGLIGGPIVLWLLWRTVGSGTGSERRERTFWYLMVPFCIVVGIAVVGERDVVGSAHVTLLPMEMLGLTLLASSLFSLPRRIIYLVIAGCVIDFSFGVFLQAGVESLENGPNRTLFGKFALVNGKAVPPPNATGLTANIWMNWIAKHRYAVFLESLDDMPQQHDTLVTLLGQDVVSWGGWFGRNGGVIRYLGDSVAGEYGIGTYVAGALFVVLFLALMFGLLDEVRAV